jgi:DNA (cytosine-5)-methyltransferase 1
LNIRLAIDISSETIAVYRTNFGVDGSTAIAADKSVYGRLSWDRPAQTITSGFGSMGQGRYVHPLRRRVITPHEAARLQGLPDFFSFDSVVGRTLLHEMIGNAVPPQLITTLIKCLIEQGAI